MSFRIILSLSAIEQTEEAYDYYEKQKEILGERFLEKVEEQYEKLTITPQHYSLLSASKFLRFIAAPHFPFIIIYQIKEDAVLIVAVHNTHKDLKIS